MGMMRQLIVGTVRNNRNPVYLIDNLDDDKSVMLSRIDPTILSAVMMFGKCFTLIGFDLYLKDYADQI